MKPSQITLDKVREAMQRSATWARYDADAAFGYPVDAEIAVYIVHGFDGSLSGETLRKSKEDARESMSFDGYRPHVCPVASQVAAARKHLKALVEEGVLEETRFGNGVSYRWITDAMRAGRRAKAALDDRMLKLDAQLTGALESVCGIVPGEGDNALTAVAVEHRMKRGTFAGRITLQLDEASANKLLAALRGTLDEDDDPPPNEPQLKIQTGEHEIITVDPVRE